jgi:hypothetical protein
LFSLSLHPHSLSLICSRLINQSCFPAGYVLVIICLFSSSHGNLL